MADRLPENHDLAARTLRSVWHPCTQMKLHERLPMVAVSHGQGAWLYDFEGRRYLDAIKSKLRFVKHERKALLDWTAE